MKSALKTFSQISRYQININYLLFRMPIFKTTLMKLSLFLEDIPYYLFSVLKVTKAPKDKNHGDEFAN